MQELSVRHARHLPIQRRDFGTHTWTENMSPDAPPMLSLTAGPLPCLCNDLPASAGGCCAGSAGEGAAGKLRCESGRGRVPLTGGSAEDSVDRCLGEVPSVPRRDGCLGVPLRVGVLVLLRLPSFCMSSCNAQGALPYSAFGLGLAGPASFSDKHLGCAH